MLAEIARLQRVASHSVNGEAQDARLTAVRQVTMRGHFAKVEAGEGRS